jgi:ATP-dependent helicase/nuclease subunit B
VKSLRQQHPNYDACQAQAVTFVRAHAAASEVVVVAATTEAANEIIRLACDTAVVGVHAITLRNLARVLADARLCAMGLAEVTAIAREALIARVASKAKLDYFVPVARTPGFPEALSRTLRELRLQSTTPDGDLQTLLELYVEDLRAGSFADVATVYQTAIQVVRERAHPFCGLPVVFLDVPAPHALERQLLDAVAGQASISLSLELDGTFAPPGVEIFSASSESLEYMEIARRTGKLAESGVPFDRTAVLARNASRVQPLLEEAFHRARIPIWFANGCVRPSTSGRALLALLHCANEGLSASRFLEYLSLGQAPQVRSYGWERLIVNGAVIGGLRRWRERLEALRLQLNSDQAKSVAELSAFALPLLERLAAFPQRATWGEWVDHLAALVEQGIHDRTYLLEFLDQLGPLAEIGPVDLQAVTALLAEHLRNLREPVEGPRYGKVFAGSIEDARGMSFECVFLPGLCEGSFPQLLREDPLLLNKDRARYGLPEIHEADERKLLHQAAASANARFVVSYPRIELGTGRARIPSLYAYEVMRAARETIFEPSELQKEAGTATQATLAWPAPAAYMDAVDDTEYDLAVLREPFETRPVQHGAAAYLAQANPVAVDALRNRWRRWHSSWHATDGIFEDIEAQIMLKDRRLTHRAYAPTTLQLYAVCPYRFYLTAIFKLKPMPQPEAAQRMDARTRGDIFHRTQALVMRELSFPIRPADLDGAYERLDEVLAAVAAEEEEMNPPAIPQVWREEIGRLRADLRGWLSELARSSIEFAPLEIEWRFQDVKLFGEYLLSGSIDVIERNASGALRIIDHKTGAPPKEIPAGIGKGEILQPILYSLAAEQVLGTGITRGRLFYATLRGNYRTIDIPVNAAGRERMRELLDHIDTAIDNGEFHTFPRKDACRSCDYRPVCGPYEEERSGRKKAIQPLIDIRRTS